MARRNKKRREEEEKVEKANKEKEAQKIKEKRQHSYAAHLSASRKGVKDRRVEEKQRVRDLLQNLKEFQDMAKVCIFFSFSRLRTLLLFSPLCIMVSVSLLCLLLSIAVGPSLSHVSMCPCISYLHCTPPPQWRARVAEVPFGRRAVHRLQAL